MSHSAEELISGIGELASLPEVFHQATRMASSPHYSAADIGRVIGKDPALSARLLKVVNSPFYGFPSSIDTVSRAITIIGSRELCSILGATAITYAFEGLSHRKVDMQRFWRHSLYSAVAARILALQLHESETEHHFLAGLLHDIGNLVLYQAVPELVSRALEDADQNERPVHESERDIIGTNHAEVGAALLRQWRLPDSLVEAVACHHDPVQARNYPREAWISHAAEIIASHSNAGYGFSRQLPDLEVLTHSSTHLLDREQLNAVQQHSAEKFRFACQAYLH